MYFMLILKSPSECDTPPALSDFAFDWLDENWKHDVDFVIVTGDNARCAKVDTTAFVNIT